MLGAYSGIKQKIKTQEKDLIYLGSVHALQFVPLFT